MKANWLHESAKALPPEYAFVVVAWQQAQRRRFLTALTIVLKRLIVNCASDRCIA